MNWFDYHILKRRYTIANLHDPKAALSEEDRGLVKILIIDDKDFEKKENLHNLGFQIQKYDDIESLEAAEAFHIVISDIKGVGAKFGSPKEGAFVLNQLKKKYPMKEFAVYSGSLYNTEISSSLQGINIINKDNISKMKDGVIIINNGRGPLVNEQDVADALKTGKLRAFAADVLSTEPPAEDNPLLSAPNCILTPHISWAPKEARIRLLRVSAENLGMFLNGTPQNRVN